MSVAYVFLNHSFHENGMLIWISTWISQNRWTKYLSQICHAHFDNLTACNTIETKFIGLFTISQNSLIRNINTNRCKCITKNAKVSRFGCGSWFMAAYNSRTARGSSTVCTAFEKFFQRFVGINGSFNPRRKSLMHPQITWISIFDRFGKDFPRKIRSLSALMSFSEPDTR